MCLIFSFDFLAEQKFREMTDTIFVDIDTESVWHTLTLRVHEYLCAGVQEYRVNEYMDAYESTWICGS